MKIAKIGKDNLYHLTSVDNFRRIAKDGGIMMSTDKSFGKESVLTGVFMVDLANFLKNWRFSKEWKGHLGYSLLKHIAGNCDEIVCLKINTKGFNPEDMYIRSQNNLCNCLLRNEGNRETALNGISAKQAEQLPETDAVEYIYEHFVDQSNIELVGKTKAMPITRYIPTNAEIETFTKNTLKELLKEKTEAQLLDIYM